MTDIKEQNRINTVVFAYFILRFINCFIPTFTVYVLLMIVVEASALLFYALKYGIRCSIKVFIPITMIFAFELFSWVVLGENHFYDLINSLLGLFLGFYLAKVKLLKKNSIILFVIFAGVIVLRIIVAGSANNIFLRSSRNNVSALLILAAVLFYSANKAEERVSLFPAFITFIFSCIGEGRGGVISSFILLAGIVLYNLFIKKKPTAVQLFLSILIVCLFVFLIRNYYDFLFSNAITRLNSQRFSENERNIILYSYFDRIKNSVSYLLFGVPSNTVAYVAQLNGNFHNSYLSLHSNFGIFGVAMILILLSTAIKKAFMNRCWLFLLLLLVVCIRIYTDGLCFVGLYDPLFYYIVFVCIFDNGIDREEIHETC